MKRVIVTGVIIVLACIVWSAIFTILVPFGKVAIVLCFIGGLIISVVTVYLRHFHYQKEIDNG